MLLPIRRTGWNASLPVASFIIICLAGGAASKTNRPTLFIFPLCSASLLFLLLSSVIFIWNHFSRTLPPSVTSGSGCGCLSSLPMPRTATSSDVWRVQSPRLTFGGKAHLHCRSIATVLESYNRITAAKLVITAQLFNQLKIQLLFPPKKEKKYVQFVYKMSEIRKKKETSIKNKQTVIAIVAGNTNIILSTSGPNQRILCRVFVFSFSKRR